MVATTKALLTKAWNNEELDIGVGRHFFHEEFMVRVSGSVEKHEDQLVAPTVSIPLVATLALFFDKCGVTRDAALNLLREAITEAMADDVNEDSKIKERIGDVEKAIKAVKEELIAKLPKMKRAGRVVTKDLEVTLTPVMAAMSSLPDTRNHKAAPIRSVLGGLDTEYRDPDATDRSGIFRTRRITHGVAIDLPALWTRDCQLVQASGSAASSPDPSETMATSNLNDRISNFWNES